VHGVELVLLLFHERLQLLELALVGASLSIHVMAEVLLLRWQAV